MEDVPEHRVGQHGGGLEDVKVPLVPEQRANVVQVRKGRRAGVRQDEELDRPVNGAHEYERRADVEDLQGPLNAAVERAGAFAAAVKDCSQEGEAANDNKLQNERCSHQVLANGDVVVRQIVVCAPGDANSVERFDYGGKKPKGREHSAGMQRR